jgi:uncharacterized protein
MATERDSGQLRDEMQKLLQSLGSRWMESDPDGMMQFWNEDGRYEFPYAPVEYGFPRVVEGKEAIHQYLAGIMKQITNIQIGDWLAFATSDPNIWYVEYHATGRAAATGRHYDQTYVARIEFKDGKFQLYREFWDPYVVLDTFGLLKVGPTSPQST